MGNVCSSGQKKKKKDSLSENSDDSSPAYQAAGEDNNSKNAALQQASAAAGTGSGYRDKLAPLAEGEIGGLPSETAATGGGNGDAAADGHYGGALNSTTARTEIGKATQTGDSTTSTPQVANAPSDIADSSKTGGSQGNLSILLGRPPPPGRKVERDKKIVIYILADNSAEFKRHKRIVRNLQRHLIGQCQAHGFEIIISDVHPDSGNDASLKQDFSQLQPIKRWTQSPLEAEGGHEEAANCMSEIARHSADAYIVPILFLGSTLGQPMLPLTIESQDFTCVLSAASEEEKQLLEKWYVIDNAYQPMCHRLRTEAVDTYASAINDELNELLGVLLQLFSNDLKDSYLTTVVEQEINNTVLMSQELAKRCIWVQSGVQYSRPPDNATPLDLEVLRRITKVYGELKAHLSEKNLIRILPTMNILDEELAGCIESLLDKSLAGIFEEHVNKNSIPHNTNGVDKCLLEELHLIGHYSKILAQNSANFDIMNDLKRYIKDGTQHPLIVAGTSGCGKSVLVSKIMENIHRWKPETHLVLRYANLTPRSSDLTSLLGSVANQMSVLAHGYQCRTEHNLEAYGQVIQGILEANKCFFVIIIDGIDEILQQANDLIWLPANLGTMAKIILTATDCDDPELSSGPSPSGSAILNRVAGELGVPPKCQLKMKHFTERQWNDILSSGGGDFYAANGALKLPDDWKSLHGKTPFHAKSLWWLAWLGHLSISINEISDILGKMLQVLETKFNAEHIEMLLLIVALSEWGIREIDCLAIFQKHTQLEAPVAFRIWSKFCWLMGPMLVGLRSLRIADKNLRDAVLRKYAAKRVIVHKAMRDYFDRLENHFGATPALAKANNYNQQKFVKLPYHHFYSLVEDQAAAAPDKIEMLLNCFYFTDLQWIADKVHACGPIHLWHDLLVAERLARTAVAETPLCIHISFLKAFLARYMHELNYDGQQFYTLMKFYLKTRIRDDGSSTALKDDEKIRSWLEFTNEIELPFLEILNAHLDDCTAGQDENAEAAEAGGGALAASDAKSNGSSYNMLVNLPHLNYVASINTEREEISIWDVQKCCRVRTLLGIPQPTAMCPVGSFEAAVLCRREIKVINLDEGKFKVTLKGVMNQKMPYFGLHDPNHLVCLSRNRMYVNLMNLESGDCITTFKAGEDRFLNSLLVSGDGRILVCGDETQKPFPLLVWHLSQRKLLYDLRIPHHDFLTGLSAITHEGSYVCVVAKELNEPTPNFIVVYDLQSGTLFKKWKPTCNTVSLAISQTNVCVIAGLEDAKILIWDLVTGNCRSTLIGHNAPVTFLKLDPLGKVLLSKDKEGRDNSIRIWELNTGKSLAVYKPPGQISTCEILPNGAFIVMALQNRTDQLLTLALKNYGDEAPDDNCYSLYGNQDNQGKTFQLT